MASIFLDNIVAVKGTGTNLNKITAPIEEAKKKIINLISTRFNLTHTEANRGGAGA